MSTKTYNFLEALKALTEGRCTGIQSQYSNTSILVLLNTGQLSWGNLFNTPVPASPSQQWLLGQWTLVDEKREPQPWSKPEHVHGPVCWLRFKKRNQMAMVTAIEQDRVWIGPDNKHEVEWKEFSDPEGWEYSTDRINWKPCIVDAK